MQVELSKSNVNDLADFIKKSKVIDREYKISPTQIVNSMLAENLHEQLKRFERKKP